MNPTQSEPSTGSTTSLTLLERAKKSDDQAWECMAQLYGPLVYRLCRVSNLQTDDSRDIVQEVFRAVFRNIANFRRDRPGDSFRGWLLTIAKNKIRDHYRRCAKTPPAIGGTVVHDRLNQIPDLEWDSSTDGSRFDSESDVVKRAVQLVQSDFTDPTWQAFWKITVEGSDPADVAQLMGMSKWSVYQAKSRVLRRIREELAGLMD